MAIYPLSPAGPAPDPVALDAPTTPTRAPRLPAGGVTTNGVTLTIPIDSETSEAKVRRTAAATSINRRDSLKRREALLRGKEGTRRRQRWENGTFFSYSRVSTVLTGFNWVKTVCSRIHTLCPLQLPIGSLGPFIPRDTFRTSVPLFGTTLPSKSGTAVTSRSSKTLVTRFPKSSRPA